MRISEISVHRPVFATVVSLMLLVVGLIGLARLWQTVREMPDIAPPVISISTEYRGASAEIVETKITQVIEDRIAGIEGIEKITSSSLDERSQIVIEFDLARDIDAAANDVRDRLSRVVAQLPEEADPPEMIKADASADPVVTINVESDRLNALELTDYLSRYVLDRFSALPGVARANMFGDRKYAMRMWLDRKALAGRGLAVTDVEAALRRENVQIPAGRLESRFREFTLDTHTGLETAEDFRQLIIGRGAGGYLVRLGEVADVELAAENERTVSRTMGRTGITVTVEAQSKANALEVSRAVHAEVEDLNRTLPHGIHLDVNIDRGVFIEASLQEVLKALVISVALVLAVMYAFLGNWRATLIPAVTIPVSMLAACAAMYSLGFTLNTLTLLGMVLAIGLVVDDAIVVLENIYRRIEAGQRSPLAALDGSREIGFAVIATTLVLIAVFLPISFLQGRVGRLFSEFGFTLVAAILFSCLVALTLTPMMTSQLFRGGAPRSAVSGWVERTFHRLEGWYRGRLRGLLARPWPIVAVAVAAVALALLALTRIPQETAPDDDRGTFRVIMLGPEGATIEYMERYMRRFEDAMAREMASGDIERYNVRIPGGGQVGTAVNRAQGFVLLKKWGERRRSQAQVIASLRAQLQDLAGVRVNFFSPSAFSWGGADPMRAVLQGPEYPQLAEWRDKVLARANQNPGLVGVDSDYKERKPEMKVMIDRNRAGELGVSLDAIGRTLETMLGSRIVTTYVKEGREYRVILQGRVEDRATPQDLADLYVRSSRTGELVPLSSVVRLEEAANTTQRNRFDRLRSITITAGFAPGYAMGDAVQFFRDVVRQELPQDARLAFDGEAREYLEASQALLWTFLGALLVVFLVLAAQFESFVLPFVIMTTVPLAIVGAVAGMLLFGITLNIYSQVAIIMLVGLAAKNGVLIVEFANQLRDRGVEFFEAIVQAAATRLRPVLMTSLCTAFGAVPLLLATGAGAESRQPIGAVVLFGVVVSMMLTLVVVPAVYLLVARGTRSPRHWSRMIDSMRASEEPAPGAGAEAGAGAQARAGQKAAG